MLIYPFLVSSARAARSRNALNSLICFNIPPESLLLLTSSATRFRTSSIPILSAAPSTESWGYCSLLRSSASSMSWIVLLRLSRSYDGVSKFGGVRRFLIRLTCASFDSFSCLIRTSSMRRAIFSRSARTRRISSRRASLFFCSSRTRFSSAKLLSRLIVWR